jgi:Rab guanine nucleotide exchange factor SEC2
MVITSREEAQKEREIVQRRNDQLKGQLADTESLLKSHQEQVSELKQVIERMAKEQNEKTNPQNRESTRDLLNEAKEQEQVCPLRGCEGVPGKFRYCENRTFPHLQLLPRFPKN